MEEPLMSHYLHQGCSKQVFPAVTTCGLCCPQEKSRREGLKVNQVKHSDMQYS